MDYYDNSYDPNLAYPTTHAATNADSVATAIVAGLIILTAVVVFIIVYAVGAFLLSRIFKKAGAPQWAAWVPIYSTWKLLEIGGQQGFWAVLALIPIVNIVSLVFVYIAMYHIGKKLGKEDWFILLAIFLPVVWIIWLGFDDSNWPTDKPARKKQITTKTPKKSQS